MMNRKGAGIFPQRIGGLVFISLWMTFSGFLLAEGAKTAYSLQVFSTKDAAKAAGYAQELRGKGYNPVFVIPKGEWQAVAIGMFDKYADAVYYKEKLNASELKGAFIVSREVPADAIVAPLTSQQMKTEEVFHGAIRSEQSSALVGRKTAEILATRPAKIVPAISDSLKNADNNTLSENELLQKANALAQEASGDAAIQAHQDFIRRFPNSSRVPDSKLSIAHLQIRKGDVASAKSSLESIMRQHLQSESAGEAALRLAYLNLGNSQKAADAAESQLLSDQSLALFESVARGGVKAAPSTRLEAMYRCAKVYHSRKDRVRALQAYREIAALTDADGRLDPDIHVEMAGLYMELARSGKGSLNDCIQECDRVLTQSGASDRNYAVASVMKGEALYLQERYQDSLDVMNALLTRFPQIKDAALTAQLHVGAVNFVQKDYARARQEFQKVLDNFTDEDNWRGGNHRADALLFLARADLAEKNFQRAGEYFEQTYRQYKKTKEGDHAKDYLIRYFPRIWEKIQIEEEKSQ